ncbi:unnamed protein product [Ixodes persulcatus]
MSTFSGTPLSVYLSNCMTRLLFVLFSSRVLCGPNIGKEQRTLLIIDRTKAKIAYASFPFFFLLPSTSYRFSCFSLGKLLTGTFSISRCSDATTILSRTSFYRNAHYRTRHFFIFLCPPTFAINTTYTHKINPCF